MRGNDVYERIIRAQIMDGAKSTLLDILALDGIKCEEIGVIERGMKLSIGTDDVKFEVSGHMRLQGSLYMFVEIEGTVNEYGVRVNRIRDNIHDLTVWGEDEDSRRWTVKEYLMERCFG